MGAFIIRRSGLAGSVGSCVLLFEKSVFVYSIENLQIPCLHRCGSAAGPENKVGGERFPSRKTGSLARGIYFIARVVKRDVVQLTARPRRTLFDFLRTKVLGL